MATDTSIRVTAPTYSRIVNAKSYLELVQNRRLSLDEAVSVSTRFTCVVAKFLIEQATKDRVLAGSIDDESFHFAPPENLKKLAPKLVEDFMSLTEELGKHPPRRQSK